VTTTADGVVRGRGVVVLSQLLLELDLVLEVDRLAMDSVASLLDISDGLLGLHAVNLEREGRVRDISLLIRVLLLLFNDVHELLLP